MSFNITYLYDAPKYEGCSPQVVTSFFFITESSFMGCEREKWCLPRRYIGFFKEVRRSTLFHMRFLSFNITSKSNCQLIASRMTLIQSHFLAVHATKYR